jgi:hypothetical protein
MFCVVKFKLSGFTELSGILELSEVGSRMLHCSFSNGILRELKTLWFASSCFSFFLFHLHAIELGILDAYLILCGR